MKNLWLDCEDDFANSLDPLHLNDELFGNGDGYTDFGELLAGDDDSDPFGTDDFDGGDSDGDSI